MSTEKSFVSILSVVNLNRAPILGGVGQNQRISLISGDVHLFCQLQSALIELPIHDAVQSVSAVELSDSARPEERVRIDGFVKFFCSIVSVVGDLRDIASQVIAILPHQIITGFVRRISGHQERIVLHGEA